MELTVHAPSCLDGQDRHILVQSAARRLVDFVIFPFFLPDTLITTASTFLWNPLLDYEPPKHPGLENFRSPRECFRAFGETLSGRSSIVFTRVVENQERG